MELSLLDNILRYKWGLFSLLLVFRIGNALVIQSAFVPDEFWQSIEVAHKWVFGYGQLTWEWQPTAAIRSPVYPLIISSFYWLAALLGWDSRRVILLLPRLLHAVMAGTADFVLYRLVRRLAGDDIAKWTLFHQLANWFTFYTATRPLVNSLEWFLSTLCLATCPWHQLLPCCRVSTRTLMPVSQPDWRFPILAVLCVLVRPTSAVSWVPLCFWHLISVACIENGATAGREQAKSRSGRLRNWHATWNWLKVYFCVSVVCLTASCLLDRLCYGRWTVNQWNFLLFNVVLNGAPIYGTHPWHWYLSQGIPALLGLQLPLAVYGVHLLLWARPTEVSSGRNRRSEQTFALVCLTLLVGTVFAYSLQGHKEFRFVMPLLPYLAYLCGRASHYLAGALERRPARLLAGSIALLHSLLALYMCLVHQRGTLDALSAVASTGRWQGSSHDRLRLLVLAPCHSLPHLSYLHQNASFRQLACPPDLPTGLVAANPVGSSGDDEVEQFYAHPVDWLRREYPEDGLLPHFILMFSHLIEVYSPAVQSHIHSLGFRECGRFFHAHFLTHRRHGHHVLVYCGRAVHLG